MLSIAWSSLHCICALMIAASWLSAGVVLIIVAACSSSLYIDSVEQSKPVKILVPRVAQACRSHSVLTCYWLNRRVLGNIEEDKRYTQSDTYIDRLSFRNRSKGGWNGNFFRMGGRGKVYRSKNNNTTFHSRGGENISRGGERPSPPPPKWNPDRYKHSLWRGTLSWSMLSSLRLTPTTATLYCSQDTVIVCTPITMDIY